jgi:malate dehydrogenase (oxaloacetate-decarboxylating)
MSIGKVGADIGNIDTVHLGDHYTVRDIEVFLDSREHLEILINTVSRIRGVKLLEVRDQVLDLHRNGKIKMVNTVPITSIDIIRKVYTPGVAEVCNLIADKPSRKNAYTCIPYSVAIVTDGTAILGLGNIGSVAGMPVMEGKAALLQHLVGISGIPILLDTTDIDEIIQTVEHIAPTFGGIQLEDIASPRCFPIHESLEKKLNIPVIHDDQQGTAVVTLAALINACRLRKVQIQEANIGVIGLGAAGIAIGKFILQYTGKPVLGTARTEASVERHVERGGVASNLDEIMQKSDIVIVIFALSNPYPEITPELARAHGASLAADGRSVNNLLGFPGILRGALDAKADKINYEMYKAAALAIADSTSAGELVPNPLSPEVHLAVTHSVARAAVESGATEFQLDDDYYINTNVKEPPWM